MKFTIMGIVAAAVAAEPDLIRAEVKLFRRPDSDDPVLDAYRRRQERLNSPGWMDQRMALRNVNGVGPRWL
jgi:hypothetical protein